MNYEPIVQLLIQIPLVGIFVWFVLQRDNQQAERDKEMRDFLRDQREEDHRVMVKIAELLEVHDKKTDQAVLLMQERTRPRKAANDS